MTRVFDKNLFVPGLIGVKDDCKFKNLQEYILGTASGIDDQIKNVVKDLRSNCA